MSSWPDIIPLLATRCLYLGVWGWWFIWFQCIWPQVYVTKVVIHMATRCLCLGEGQFDILFDRQSASQPAAIGQQISHVTKYQLVRLEVGHILGGREGQFDILYDRQLARQLACRLLLASQPSTWQNINLSGFGLVRYVVAGGPGAWPHWPQSRLPTLPLVPLGEWPILPWPDKWHKWPLQPVIYLWHYILGPFAVLYLCCFITYACTHCREMLYRLCYLQTNLHISFHHQSDVSLQQGTTFTELLLSPEIRNAMENIWKRYIWTQVNQTLAPVLATRCLSWWGLHLTEGKADHKANQMSSWPDIIPLLATRCLYWGYVWAQVNWTQVSSTLDHKMPLPGGTSELGNLTENIKLTWCSTALDH